MADDTEDFEEPAGEVNVRKPMDIRSAFAHASVLSEARVLTKRLEVCGVRWNGFMLLTLQATLHVRDECVRDECVRCVSV